MNKDKIKELEEENYMLKELNEFYETYFYLVSSKQEAIKDIEELLKNKKKGIKDVFR